MGTTDSDNQNDTDEGTDQIGAMGATDIDNQDDAIECSDPIGAMGTADPHLEGDGARTRAATATDSCVEDHDARQIADDVVSDWRCCRSCCVSVVSQPGEMMAYFNKIEGVELVARRGYSDMADWKDTFGNVLGKVGGALNWYGDKARSEGAVKAYEQAAAAQMAAAQARPSTPSWLLPVAIGGGALVLVMAMKGRR